MTASFRFSSVLSDASDYVAAIKRAATPYAVIASCGARQYIAHPAESNEHALVIVDRELQDGAVGLRLYLARPEFSFATQVHYAGSAGTTDPPQGPWPSHDECMRRLDAVISERLAT